MDKLVVSTSAHIKDIESIPRIMWGVNLALLPTLIGAVYFFGVYALWIVLSSVVSAVITEAVVQKFILKRPVTVSDGSAVTCGILLAFSIPPAVPLWLPAVGSFVAMAIAKQCFGGLGWNVFNPAMIGRAFLLISWPIEMTTWTLPLNGMTGASPLGILKKDGLEKVIEFFGDRGIMYTDLFIGNIRGSLGETSCVLLLLGAIYLLYKRYISWHIPVSFLGTVAGLSWIIGGDPLFAILSGGCILGAFFIATDMVTSPVTKTGQLIFGAGIGALVVLIRAKAGYPEGVCYAVLLMNTLTPLIDRWIKPKPYGVVKK
ncbi:MAG: RnfABCDGE type electron transport complex subunit D [bacterium]|nr:RnfABCDGE type electron transport complex subunit D [bacterium]